MEVIMSGVSKSLFVTSLATSAVGIFVTATPMPLAPVWTVALPAGAISFGLFLISYVFHDQTFNSTQEETVA